MPHTQTALRLRRAYHRNGIPWDATLLRLPEAVMLETAEYWEGRAKDDADNLLPRLRRPTILKNANVGRTLAASRRYQGDDRHD